MGKKWDKSYTRVGIMLTVTVCVCMVFYEILKARRGILAYIGKIFSALAPVIIGIVIAFLLAPIMVHVRRGITFLCCKIKKNAVYDEVYKHTKLPALIITMLFFIGLLAGFLSLVIPSLYTSISDLVQNMPSYLDELENWATKAFAKNPKIQDWILDGINYLKNNVFNLLKDNVMPNLDTIASKVSSGVLLGVKAIMNFFIGTIVAIYLLYGKEKLLAQMKKLIYCVFSRKTANKIMKYFSFANNVFGGFINGKIVDSIIIGVLCFIFTTAVGMKYAVLVSVIVGVTNIIPFFGPFIGAVPGSLLALMDDPMHFVIFIIWIIVLQQFDGNILGPLILGDATGLPSFWVLVSILVGGGLFGVPGMILGVPVFACIYAMIAVFLRDGLAKKELSTDTEDYYRLESIDEETGERKYKEKHEVRSGARRAQRKKLLHDKIHVIEAHKKVKHSNTVSKTEDEDKK